MFAKVENNQIVAVNSSKSFFKNSSGVYEVIYNTTNLKDTEFYYNGAETFTFANDQVTASYAPATAKALNDVNAVDQNGQPLLDQEGKQVINKGLKSNHIARIKSQAAGALQSTDWYIIRNAESGASIPANVSTYRAAVRTKSNDMEALINAVSSVEQLAALYVYDKDTKSRPLGDFPRL
jgi:16S rRNA G527 N7-methylase RsmG